MSLIEALYIFDEHKYSDLDLCAKSKAYTNSNPILEHTWTGRPPSAKTILPLYLAHPQPRPSLLYLTETNPPSLVFSIIHNRLLFLSPSSSEIEPILVLEFLHRVADALEDFLGSPLIASKIESAYDVVAQLLGEMCDAGLVDKTEPNALRDVVEAPSKMDKFLAGVGLPAGTAATNTPSLGMQRKGPVESPAIPWRRANVRHTSNELYVDMIESLSVIIAPSGRPLKAMAYGTIAFTSKVSGIPDLNLNLTCPGGRMAIENTIQLPVFHPCVRLARWKEQPGSLSFVPPDGRFVLAAYEVDLLGKDYLERAFTDTKYKPDLRIPATAEIVTGLGDMGTEFEVRLHLNPRYASGSSTSSSGLSGGGGLGGPNNGLGARSAGGTSGHPMVEDIVVTVPIPSGVRNLTDLRASRGEATYSPGDGGIEWRVTSKDLAALGSSSATLRCTVLGPLGGEDEDTSNNAGLERRMETWEYDDAGSYNTTAQEEKAEGASITSSQNNKRARQSAVPMPTSAAVSFTVKGWLASGIKVDKLNIDAARSKGLGAGVQPYKGVKYLTVSRKGVEVRCQQPRH